MELLHSLQSAKTPKGVEVDLKKLADTADAHAFEVWGEEIARGEPFPVSNAEGHVRAYVFPYALGTRMFPADMTLADRQPEKFGAVYVAARPTAQPVLLVDHSLHSLFIRGRKAQEVGRIMLASAGARLTRIYWLGPHQEYFEITAAGRRLLLDVRSLKEVDPKIFIQSKATIHLAEETTIAAAEAVTMEALPAIEVGGMVHPPMLKLVPLAECIPVVNWTYWCVPTAATMVVCYYDNYLKGIGGILGYGRLVGHWFEHPQSGNNVPDFIDLLIDPNSGPPPTWRSKDSISDVINKTYGYSFSTHEVDADSTNDWAWADITAEIDAGRPFIWAISVPNHSMCAFGYRIAFDGSKRVVVYNTWGDTPQKQRQEWLYTEGKGLRAIIPGGGTDGHDLVLWTPDGGETLLTNVVTTVRWHVWGTQIKTAEIAVSSDGGNTWQTIAHAAPCVPGWNYYDWKPDTVTDRARVRVRGLGAGGAYASGDGSQSNLKVLPGPRPVKLNTILVNAKTDATGFFSAPHGLERYTPDGFVIRAISVAVQHKNGNWQTLEHSNNIDNRFWWNKDIVAGVIASPNFFQQPVQIIIFAESIAG
jgi:hypothetical protein